MSVDDTTWSEIRRCYEMGTESAAALARRFSISAERIRRRAKRDGWVPGRAAVRHAGQGRRATPSCRPCAQKLPDSATSRKRSKPHMVDRLYEAIDLKLTRLEARMRAEEPTTAADSEREARELASMIRSLEQVSELKANIAGQGARHGDKGAATTPADAERMRAEIAERLERLFGGRTPDGGAGGTEQR